MQKAYGDNSPLAFIPEFSSQKQSLALFGLFQTESEYVPDYISPFSSAVAHEAPLFYFLHLILRLVSCPALGHIALLGSFCQL